MNEKEREKLEKVLDMLMEHPCVQIFIDPVEPGIDCPEDYFQLISHPTSLLEVLNGLKQGTVGTLELFMKEVEFCWSNAELYHGKLHPIGIVAAEGRRIFHKLMIKYGPKTPETFCRSVQKFQERMGILVDAMTLKGRKTEFNDINDLLTEKELLEFQASCELLTNPKDHMHIKKIIAEHQPDLIREKGNQTIVLTRLKKSTFKALKAYIKEALHR